MDFPLEFAIGRLRVSGHFVFEVLAYAVGLALWAGRLRARASLSTSTAEGTDPASRERWTLSAAALVGAALGSKLSALAAHPTRFLEHASDPAAWLLGKSIVGGLLGGWLGVELAKQRLRIRRRTGDPYVVPLCIAIAIGRVGCFVSGLEDATHGLPTDLAWGIDFGDGVTRHPVRLVEIAFVLSLAVLLPRLPTSVEGRRFRWFLAAYFAFRVVIDFHKPTELVLGLGGLQWLALLGLGCVLTAHLRGAQVRDEREWERLDPERARGPSSSSRSSSRPKPPALPSPPTPPAAQGASSTSKADRSESRTP